MIEGGCFCGAVRYAIEDGSYPCVDCHCSMCRRVHGAAYVSWLIVPPTAHRYTRGEPKALASSETGTRWFCADCGSHLACVNETHPDIIDIPLGSLDRPELHPPTRAFYCETRMPWIEPTGAGAA